MKAEIKQALREFETETAWEEINRRHSQSTWEAQYSKKDHVEELVAIIAYTSIIGSIIIIISVFY